MRIFIIGKCEICRGSFSKLLIMSKSHFGFCQSNFLIVAEWERWLMARQLESVEEYHRDPFADVFTAFIQTSVELALAHGTCFSFLILWDFIFSNHQQVPILFIDTVGDSTPPWWPWPMLIVILFIVDIFFNLSTFYFLNKLLNFLKNWVDQRWQVVVVFPFF